MNLNKTEANKEQRPTDVASGAVLGFFIVPMIIGCGIMITCQILGQQINLWQMIGCMLMNLNAGVLIVLTAHAKKPNTELSSGGRADNRQQTEQAARRLLE